MLPTLYDFSYDSVVKQLNKTSLGDPIAEVSAPFIYKTRNMHTGVPIFGINLDRLYRHELLYSLYIFFWVFPRRQIVVGRHFGTLCQFHLQRLDVVCDV